MFSVIFVYVTPTTVVHTYCHSRALHAALPCWGNWARAAWRGRSGFGACRTATRCCWRTRPCPTTTPGTTTPASRKPPMARQLTTRRLTSKPPRTTPQRPKAHEPPALRPAPDLTRARREALEPPPEPRRPEAHTAELQSLMHTSS